MISNQTLRLSFAATALVTFLYGCASSSENVSATYVSPIEYSGYSCPQIRAELSRVSRNVMHVSGQQDKAATRDAWAMGVGLVLFWPALFFITPEDQSDQLARLKGKYEALESAAIQKNCDVASEIRIARERQQTEHARKQAASESEYQLPGQETSYGESTPREQLSNVGSASRPASSYGSTDSIRSAEPAYTTSSNSMTTSTTISQRCRTSASTDPPGQIYQQNCKDSVAMIYRCEYRSCSQLR